MSENEYLMENKLTSQRKQKLHALEQKMGVQFRNIAYLDTALTHTSYANEAKRSTSHNERLEFLGDAVLELASSTYLYGHYPGLPEGELTKTRASIVCSATLAKLAGRLGLGEALQLGHGEEMGGGRTRTSNLEDAFEAVIGAIYLDQGWATAQDYVLRQLEPEFESIRHGENLQDYKTILQELVQRKPNRHVEYVELSAKGPDHARSYEFAARIDDVTYGIGIGRSKKEAEQRAAKEALDSLQK